MTLFQDESESITPADLIELAAQDGFHGNLWQVYLTLLLVGDENAFTLRAEGRGEVQGGMREAALQDLHTFHKLFSLDAKEVAARFNIPENAYLLCFEAEPVRPENFSTFIRDRIQTLSEALGEAGDAEEMLSRLLDFYHSVGVGTIGLHKAFRIEGGHEKRTPAQLVPIRNISHVSLEDLVGYERQKDALVRNTKAFVEGRSANNVLLYGDAGTGKSTSIKAIANQFYSEGLRVIEVYRHQFKDIHDVITQIKNRNYKFILYMDDLSFEDFETEYKYLKAVIEGGLEKRPKNVLVYATSNRRHLVKERFSDKASLDEDDIRHSDTVQEKLSLAARFGLPIYFGPPGRKEFNAVVETLAQRCGITMPKETLIAEATKWEIAHGGLSGRCAQQFIDDLLSGSSV